MRKVLAGVMVGLSVAAASLFVAPHASAVDNDAWRCPDRVVRSYFEQSNVYHPPRSHGSVVKVAVLKALSSVRSWDGHQCVLDGYRVAPVYRDFPNDGTDRKHLVFTGNYGPSDWHLGFGLPYWEPFTSVH